MFRQIIGAALGSKVAAQAPAIGGVTGAAIATAVPFVISRISIPAMLVIGVGSYVAKRHFDKKKTEDGDQPAAKGNAGSAEVPASPTGTVINPPSGRTTNGSGKKSGSSAAPA